MNRMFIVFVSAAISFALSTSALSAQTAEKPKSTKALPTGTTKVAVFNVGVVFTKYEAANAAKADLAEQMKRLQAEAKELTDDLAKWQNALQKGEVPPNKKELYEEKIINARRQLEDLSREARTSVGKKQEAILVQLWKDVRAAVKSYSAEHDIELVIAYGDVNVKGQEDLFPNISRKMAALDQGGSMPFFMMPGVDISDALINVLNRQYREKKAQSSDDDPQ